jgi:hypothetical protein
MPDQDQNFMRDYLLYSSGNEANPNYHLWSGLVTLATVISRRVWLDFGYFKISPNLYVVLLGPPGNKKTTAMRVAKTFLHQLCKKDPNLIPFSAQCQSKENLVKELFTYKRKFTYGPNGEADTLEYTPLSIFVTELSQFLGTSTAGHMLDFLTTIWDGDPYDRSTNLHGKEFIPNPFVCMLGCTTPNWITGYLKTDVITGGFSRRAIFVYEIRDGEPVPFPRLTEEQLAAYQRMIDRGTALLSVGGEIKWDPSAKERWEQWYVHNQRNLPRDENLQFYFRTKWVQILKVAMLMSLSRSNQLVLQWDSVEAAMAVLDKMEQNLPKVFQGIGRNELSAISAQVIELLYQAQGPVRRKQVESTLWANADQREIYNIIQHLLASEKLFEVSETLPNGVKRAWLCLPEHIEKLKAEGKFHVPPPSAT